MMIGPRLIRDPGVYDVSAALYHADPVEGGSLSSTGARRLLPPSCPALFRHQADNPQPLRSHFDLGAAAHMLVLGAGPEIVVVEHDSWRTAAAKAAAAAARARGAVPLLRKDYDVVAAMAEALAAHPAAAALFAPGTGEPEKTLVWQDTETGVWCRARLDWLPTIWGGELIIPDYKTAAAADLASFERAAGQFGYHQQAEWYLSGARALKLSRDPRFVFVVQEKQPPYLVQPYELDIRALELARIQNADARRVYAACVATGRWPGYSDEVELAALPAYVDARIERTHELGAFPIPHVPSTKDPAA